MASEKSREQEQQTGTGEIVYLQLHYPHILLKMYSSNHSYHLVFMHKTLIEEFGYNIEYFSLGSKVTCHYESGLCGEWRATKILTLYCRKQISDMTKQGLDATKRPHTTTQSPDAIKQSIDTAKRGPDVTRQGLHTTKRGSDVTNQGPNTMRESSGTIKQSSNTSKQSLDINIQGPDTTKQSPPATQQRSSTSTQNSKTTIPASDTTTQSPQTTKKDFDLSKQGPDVIKQSPDTGKQEKLLAPKAKCVDQVNEIVSPNGSGIMQKKENYDLESIPQQIASNERKSLTVADENDDQASMQKPMNSILQSHPASDYYHGAPFSSQSKSLCRSDSCFGLTNISFEELESAHNLVSKPMNSILQSHPASDSHFVAPRAPSPQSNSLNRITSSCSLPNMPSVEPDSSSKCHQGPVIPDPSANSSQTDKPTEVMPAPFPLKNIVMKPVFQHPSNDHQPKPDFLDTELPKLAAQAPPCIQSAADQPLDKLLNLQESNHKLPKPVSIHLGKSGSPPTAQIPSLASTPPQQRYSTVISNSKLLCYHETTNTQSNPASTDVKSTEITTRLTCTTSNNAKEFLKVYGETQNCKDSAKCAPSGPVLSYTADESHSVLVFPTTKDDNSLKSTIRESVLPSSDVRAHSQVPLASEHSHDSAENTVPEPVLPSINDKIHPEMDDETVPGHSIDKRTPEPPKYQHSESLKDEGYICGYSPPYLLIKLDNSKIEVFRSKLPLTNDVLNQRVNFRAVKNKQNPNWIIQTMHFDKTKKKQCTEEKSTNWFEQEVDKVENNNAMLVKNLNHHDEFYANRIQSVDAETQTEIVKTALEAPELSAQSVEAVTDDISILLDICNTAAHIQTPWTPTKSLMMKDAKIQTDYQWMHTFETGSCRDLRTVQRKDTSTQTRNTKSMVASKRTQTLDTITIKVNTTKNSSTQTKMMKPDTDNKNTTGNTGSHIKLTEAQIREAWRQTVGNVTDSSSVGTHNLIPNQHEQEQIQIAWDAFWMIALIMFGHVLQWLFL